MGKGLEDCGSAVIGVQGSAESQGRDSSGIGQYMSRVNRKSLTSQHSLQQFAKVHRKRKNQFRPMGTAGKDPRSSPRHI